MTIRKCSNIITHINSAEIPLLPPQQPQQGLTDGEIKDMLTFGSPSSWTREMDRQGFDPIEHTVDELVSFLERIELSEDFDHTATNEQAIPKKDKKKQGKTPQKILSGRDCLFHGPNTHPSNECKVLQSMIAKERGGNSDSKPPYKNKTWKRDDGKKKDLNAIIRKAVRQEMNSFNKKQKVSDGSDSDESGEVNNVDLDDFNYNEDINIEDLDVDDTSKANS